MLKSISSYYYIQNGQIDNQTFKNYILGTGTITKSELKHFYTAFMDVGKLGDKELDDLTTKSFNALTSVSSKRLESIHIMIQVFRIVKTILFKSVM